jgi:hypothetical protein
MQHPNDPRPHDPRRPIRHRVDPFWETCPLERDWPTWDLFNVSRRTPQGAALVRHRAAQRLRGVRDLGELVLNWDVAQDDPGRLVHERGGDPSGRHPFSSHIHTEVTIDRHRIHMDVITTGGFGPGRSLTEARVFVDGVVAGQAWEGGCSLGAGGNSFPAIARIGRRTALVVDIDREPRVALDTVSTYRLRTDALVQRPCAWLWEASSAVPQKGARRRPLLAQRDARMFRDWGPLPERKDHGYTEDDWLDGVDLPEPRRPKLPA